MSDAHCIHCFKAESNKTPWCPDNPGLGCQYGLGHEYPCAVCGNLLCKTHVPGEEAKPKQAPKKPDKKLCTKCGLHVKNPAAATNGCEHDYPV